MCVASMESNVTVLSILSDNIESKHVITFSLLLPLPLSTLPQQKSNQMLCFSKMTITLPHKLTAAILFPSWLLFNWLWIWNELDTINRCKHCILLRKKATQLYWNHSMQRVVCALWRVYGAGVFASSNNVNTLSFGVAFVDTPSVQFWIINKMLRFVYFSFP